jgi:heme-degrading monooxygenase HmoA
MVLYTCKAPYEEPVMALIPDLAWTAPEPRPGPGVVVHTHLHLRRLRDVPSFFRTSVAVYRQAVGSPGARSVRMRAEPFSRRFTTVSWWDDAGSVRAYAAAEPHRSAMRSWRSRMDAADIAHRPGVEGVAPALDAGVTAAP